MKKYINDLVFKDFIILKSEFQIKYFIFLLLKCSTYLSFAEHSVFSVLKPDCDFSQNILKRLSTYSGINIFDVASDLLGRNMVNEQYQKECLLMQNKILFKLSCTIYNSIKEKNKRNLIFLFNYSNSKILSNFHENEAAIFQSIMIKDNGITSKANLKEKDIKDFAFELKRQNLKSAYVGYDKIVFGDFSNFLKSFGRYMFDNNMDKRERFFKYAESTEMKDTEILSFFKNNTKFNNKT